MYNELSVFVGDHALTGNIQHDIRHGLAVYIKDFPAQVFEGEISFSGDVKIKGSGGLNGEYVGRILVECVVYHERKLAFTIAVTEHISGREELWDTHAGLETISPL